MRFVQPNERWWLLALGGLALVGVLKCGVDTVNDGSGPADKSPGGPTTVVPVTPVPVGGNTAAQCAPVSRFDSVDFGRATIQSNSLGGATARFAIGVDEVGNLSSDGQGNLSYEQHPVVLAGDHPLSPLAPVDRESLAWNSNRYLVAANPASAPLWQELIGEVARPWAQAEALGGTDLNQAAIQADGQGVLTVSLSIGIDTVGTLRADTAGNLSYEEHRLIGPEPQQQGVAGAHPLLPVSPTDAAALAENVEKHLGLVPGGASTVPALSPWTQLLARVKTDVASASRFDSLDFRRASYREDSLAAIDVYVSIGVDTVGHLRADRQGDLSYEQHLVALGGNHPLTALAPADRESLVVNVQRALWALPDSDAALAGRLLMMSVRCQ